MIETCWTLLVSVNRSLWLTFDRVSLFNHVIVDTLGVDPYSYEVDLADCEAYAVQVSVGQRTAEGVLEGGVVGGVLGAVLGNSDSAKRGAGAGAVVGGVKGNKSARHEQDRIVKRCLKGRGYRVLN